MNLLDPEEIQLFTITFEIKCELKFGENMYLFGSLPQLGNWKSANAKLIWSEGHVWKFEMTLPKDIGFFEYKFVIVENSKETWEKGHNRLFTRRHLKDEEKIQVKAVWEKFYIFFTIYYPLTNPDEILAIMGGPSAIGKWFKSTVNPVKMELGPEKNIFDYTGQFWEKEVEFDVKDRENFEFEYKYCIFNFKTRSK